MAENLLSDARVRSASFEVDGHYLPDGGGLRIRLLAPSRNHPKGARLAEYHYKVKVDGEYRHGSIHLGTIGDRFTDDTGRTRVFTLADARRKRDAARDQVSRGLDPREVERLAQAEAAEAQRQRLVELNSRRTVREAFERWHELYVSIHRTDGGDYVKGMFERHLLPDLGDTPLDALRRVQVADALDKVTAAGARRTANVCLALLRQFLRWCAARDWIANDPTASLTRRAVGGEEKPRQRTLSNEEIVELHAALPASKLPQRLQQALWVILGTGCRVGELSGAKVSEFDLDGGTWRIPETKNGKPHMVHLSRFVVSHLRALLPQANTYLLPGRSDTDDNDRPIDDKFISKAVADRQRLRPLKGRTKRADVLVLAGGRWTCHDLRRTMASRMRELGISSDVIERCLNHTPQGIVGTYQTSELLPERKAAFEAWGNEIERLLKVDRPNVAALPTKAAA